MYMNIAKDILIKLRKDRGWSQEKLAAISSISERTIQRVEKDGNCSLDTKMALASAFEISPTELVIKQENKPDYKIIIDWGGAVGLFILGLAIPVIILLTGTNGMWEISCAAIVWGLSVILSIMNYGAGNTYRLFGNTSWIVKYPTYVSGLNTYISHAKFIIVNSYIIGVVASLVTALTLAQHTSMIQDNLTHYFTTLIRPLVYAILFSEFWFRPYKRKMEKMLQCQNKQIN